MKAILKAVLVMCGLMLGAGCASSHIVKKAEEYRRSGVAQDMAEARRMAENYYWPESARTKEEAARRERDAMLLKR